MNDFSKIFILTIQFVYFKTLILSSFFINFNHQLHHHHILQQRKFILTLIIVRQLRKELKDYLRLCYIQQQQWQL